MNIRYVETGDFTDWQRLWLGFLAYHDVSLSTEHTQKVWQRLLNKSDPICALVAQIDGKIVGFTHFFFHRNTWSGGDYCYLEDLFVDQNIRARGVGRALIEAVGNVAREKGASKIYWNTHDDNDTARRLYDKIANLTDFIQYEIKL